MAGKTLLPAFMALPFLLWGHVKVAADKQLANAHDGDTGVMRRILTTTSDEICQMEIAACAGDTSCITCYDVYVNAAEDECDVDDDANCWEAQQFFCCTLEDEDENCEGDTKFSDLIECLWRTAVDTGVVNCGYSDAVDLSECNGDLSEWNGDLSEWNGVTGRYLSWSVMLGLCSTAATGVVVAATGFVV